MPAFLDSSALVKQVVDETGSDEVRRLVNSDPLLWVSELATIEGVSALAKKVRKAEVSAQEFPELVDALALLLAEGPFEVVPIDEAEKERARSLLTSYAPFRNLGSLDALQLATALSVREELGSADLAFYCSDRRLAAAARDQGFSVKTPGLS